MKINIFFRLVNKEREEVGIHIKMIGINLTIYLNKIVRARTFFIETICSQAASTFIPSWQQVVDSLSKEFFIQRTNNLIEGFFKLVLIGKVLACKEMV